MLTIYVVFLMSRRFGMPIIVRDLKRFARLLCNLSLTRIVEERDSLPRAVYN